MNPSLLRDDLYLLAHDDGGKTRIDRSALNIGLSGALLIDLLLAGRIDLDEGRVYVYDRRPTGDPFADRAVDAILSLRNPHEPQTWVGWLAEGAYERVRDGLVAKGIVEQTTSRRLGLVPVTRYQPVTNQSVVHVHARTRYAVLGLEKPDPITTALCALIGVLRLESRLYVDASPAELLQRLDQLNQANHPSIRALVAGVDAAAATASVALYR